MTSTHAENLNQVVRDAESNGLLEIKPAGIEQEWIDEGNDLNHKIPEPIVDGNQEPKKPGEQRKDYKTRAQLMEQVDGLQMRCESLITMIEALQTRNLKLTTTAHKATLKAEAYKEMLYEFITDSEEKQSGESITHTVTFPEV